MTWAIGTEATLNPDSAGTSGNLIDNNPATTVTFPTDPDANYHVYGDMTGTTAIGLMVDPVTSGQLTFHLTIYPPSASNWALRISPLEVTAGERYFHVFTLADRYASSGTISGPRYPVTEEELQQRLRDAFLNGWPGSGPFLSTHYEVTAALYQYGGASPGSTVQVAELKICDLIWTPPAAAAPFRLHPRRDTRAVAGVRTRRPNPARVYPRQR